MTVEEEYGAVAAYNMGSLNDPETIKLFQHLVDTNRTCQHAGYKRLAEALVEHGLVKPKYRGLTLIIGGLCD